MKIHLNLEFESMVEMQDWIVREAELLQLSPIMADAVPLIQPVAENPPAEPAPAPKPKRKRRTKKEMEAARAAEAAAKKGNGAEPAVAEPVEAEPVEAEPVEAEPVEAEPVEAEPAVAKPVVAEPVVSTGLKKSLKEEFTKYLSKDAAITIGVLDGYTKGNFTSLPVNEQGEVLKALELQLGAL